MCNRRQVNQLIDSIYFLFVTLFKPVSESCDQNICENGATCKILAGDYICECLQGYVGAFCEEKGACYAILSCHLLAG